ncbi:tetraspanin-36-like [Lingula anatina]|uniref:Tetraspanin-36-like n=1 Tax=Lingula anatina TaxID=7574 RepID=A0A1S3H542_LINAN|nr:tetraspanin-36-like [Lingula anatina]|eukprot:XP_013381255.1 tetraspanin-36-like [Lingula anatina]
MAGVNTAKALTPNEARIGLLIQLAIWCFVGGAVGLVAYGPLFTDDHAIRDSVKDIFGHPDIERAITTAQSLLIATYVIGFLPLVAVLIACVLLVLICRQKRALRTQILFGILLVSALTLFICGVAVLAIADQGRKNWSADSDQTFRVLKSDILTKYGMSETHEKLTDGLDRIQTQYKCCGVDNVTDFWESQWKAKFGQSAPESCCNLETDESNTTALEKCKQEAEYLHARIETNITVLQVEGCRDAIKTFIEGQVFHTLILSGGVAAFLAFVVIALVIAIIVLSVLDMRKTKKKVTLQEVDSKAQAQALL